MPDFSAEGGGCYSGLYWEHPFWTKANLLNRRTAKSSMRKTILNAIRGSLGSQITRLLLRMLCFCFFPFLTVPFTFTLGFQKHFFLAATVSTCSPGELWWLKPLLRFLRLWGSRAAQPDQAMQRGSLLLACPFISLHSLLRSALLRCSAALSLFCHVDEELPRFRSFSYANQSIYVSILMFIMSTSLLFTFESTLTRNY